MKALVQRLALVLALVFPLAAQADFQTWLGVFYTAGFGKRWLAYGEVQNRFYQDGLTERRLLLRGAVGMRVGKSHSFYLGYAWTPLFSPAFQDEHRLWQGSLAHYIWPDWQLAFRFRMEERFMPGTDVSLRWRELVRVSWHPTQTWGVVFWDEFFFNLATNAVATKRGFEQNRLFVGAVFPLAESLSIEGGYMNLYEYGQPIGHTVVLSLAWNTVPAVD
ncbi:DUF2490 domain-containing protein [bacterium]|nr:DUF2490 domain-containing protein [bacterium]